MSILNDLTSRNDKRSNSKTWAFIGSAVATWIMIYTTLHDKMSWEFLVVYLGTVGGFAQLSKWIAFKYGINEPETKQKSKTESDEGSG